MYMRHVFSALLIISALFGCYADDLPYTTSQEPTYELNPEDSIYTVTEAVFIDGQKVGYTFTWMEVPVGSSNVQFTEPGVKMIKNLDFKDIGVMHENGATYKFDKDNIGRKICHSNTKKDLAIFFDKPFGKVEIKPIK